MQTSRFSYLPEFDTGVFNYPKFSEREGYVATWYSRDDIPAEYWDTKSDCAGGWYRYTKLHPFSRTKRVQEIVWPAGYELFNAQVAWDDAYTPKVSPDVSHRESS